MNLIKTPMKGMPEQTPNKMIVRNYVKDTVEKIYQSFGFLSIETPAIENIENLLSKQGGENEQLIFKILKRGDKLKQNIGDLDNMCDCGLRYDLTLPLTRFYSNNRENLPRPFKAFQIGNVWRADRPQKGRFRQFTQCDIDIFGDNTNLAEIELILATFKALKALSLENAVIRINDRQILKDMAKFSGFQESDYDNLFIIIDKLDKIGYSGIKEELEKLNYPQESIIKYCDLLNECENLQNCGEFLKSNLDVYFNEKVANNLDEIINSVRKLSNNEIKILFDPTLVRGMGYYTGPIFEIQLAPYNYSIGGGGRYDGMVEKFTGEKVSGCGFSLGFERIVDILIEQGFQAPNSKKQIIFFIDKNCDIELKLQVIDFANSMRDSKNITIAVKNNNFYNQKQQFSLNGINEFYEIYSIEDLAKIKNNI